MGSWRSILGIVKSKLRSEERETSFRTNHIGSSMIHWMNELKGEVLKLYCAQLKILWEWSWWVFPMWCWEGFSGAVSDLLAVAAWSAALRRTAVVSKPSGNGKEHQDQWDSSPWVQRQWCPFFPCRMDWLEAETIYHFLLLISPLFNLDSSPKVQLISSSFNQLWYYHTLRFPQLYIYISPTILHTHMWKCVHV